MRERLQKQLVAALATHLAGGPLRIPEAGRLLWGWFIELHATRTYHAAGPHPIAYAEIEAWARLNRWPLQPHHVDIIRAMDSAWLDHAYAKVRRVENNASGLPTGREQAINAAAFDAVFA